MSKAVKITLIVGAIFICIGLILVFSTGFSTGWKFLNVEWEMKVYECEKDAEIDDIDLDFSAGMLKVVFYEGDVIQVRYPKCEQVNTQFSVKNKTLKVTPVVNWHIQFMWFNKVPTTTVFIPNGMQLGLKLNVSAGMVTIDEGTFKKVDVKMSAGVLEMGDVDCGSFTVDMSAGSINVKKLACDDIDLDLSAGSANIGVVGAKYEYSIKTSVSAGSCNVKNQSGSTVKKLSVDMSAGSVKITFGK